MSPRSGTPSHNLPTRLTSFIGREREIADLATLVQAERLVSLVGAPGVGKTRLGLQIATRLVDRFPDGAWLVELAPLTDEAHLPQAVAEVLEVQEQRGRTLIATLAERLRTRRLLVVLDNCEHLIGAVAAVAERLLESCSDVHVLATSREPLSIGGEIVRRVPSLTVPVADPLQRGSDGGLGAIASAEAVRLFVDRARVADASFALMERSAPLVAQICRRLDGIPLAIELAAARVRALSVEQIAARLDDRFRLLTGGSRTALPRQQTLRGTIDWSYDLLSEPERALLRQLAVFAGGFTLEDAEAVCGGGVRDDRAVTTAVVGRPSLPAAPSILDSLVSLIDKSLVQVDRGADAERWYWLLDTLRQYGVERLAEQGELDDTRDRHRDFFLTLVEGAEQRLTGPDERYLLARLDGEYDNLRAAMGWSLEPRDQPGGGQAAHGDQRLCATHDPAVRIAGSLWRYWGAKGRHHAEGLRWLERALGTPMPDEMPATLSARANAYLGAAHLAAQLADYASTIRYSEDALAFYRRAGDDRGIVTALQRLGQHLIRVGEAERGMALCEESVALARSSADQYTLGFALNTLAIVAWNAGHFARSVALFEESLAIYREIDYVVGIAYVLRFMSRSVCDGGDPARALPLAEEALAISQRIGGRVGEAADWQMLGHIARELRDPERAIEMLRLSVPAQRDLGEDRRVALSLHDLAGALTLRGARDGSMPEGDDAATVAARQGYVAAVRLFAAADAFHEARGIVLPTSWRSGADRDLAILRQQLGEPSLEQALAEGRAMSLDAAVAYALDLMTPEQSTSEATAPTEHGPVVGVELSRLTAREREVAGLVAKGLSNRQIAEMLTLSERTVDAHIRSILGKLGARSRAQIAAWSVGQGLAELPAP
jgi:predicted ATPase/DNA-binding CsgD family transcriptional regulator